MYGLPEHKVILGMASVMKGRRSPALRSPEPVEGAKEGRRPLSQRLFMRAWQATPLRN